MTDKPNYKTQPHIASHIDFDGWTLCSDLKTANNRVSTFQLGKGNNYATLIDVSGKSPLPKLELYVGNSKCGKHIKVTPATTKFFYDHDQAMKVAEEVMHEECNIHIFAQ